MTSNERLGQAVEIFGGDVGLNVPANERERLRDDAAGGRHRLDFTR